MSLSPFDSFQSRFVTYLLNFPRILIHFMFITLRLQFLSNMIDFLDIIKMFQIAAIFTRINTLISSFTHSS